MSEFVINPKLLKENMQELEGIGSSVKRICSNLNSIKNQITFYEIKEPLQSIISNVEIEQDKISALREALNQITQWHILCENKIKTDSSIYVSGWKNKVDCDTEQSEKPWYYDLNKIIPKTLLDIVGQAGDLGGQSSLLLALLKMAIDGDGITPKDLGSILKGMGNSAIKFMQNDGLDDLEKYFGLNTFKTLVTDAQAGWLKNATSTFKTTLKDKVSLSGTKVAGWTFALIANGFSNYEEYESGTISGGRAVAETISETLIDIGKGALITAGVASGAAALGFAAPAVVVGGVAVAVSAVADVVCKNITGKNVTEWISDGILDLGGKAIDGLADMGSKLTGAISSGKNVICGWAKKLSIF